MPPLAPPPVTRAEIASVLRCAAPPTVPPFLPAIYEHKGWFIGRTPSAISRDAGLLTRALLAEYEAIGPDALTIGVDVYNLEAEALGCPVTFYEGDDASIPGIRPDRHIVPVGADLMKAPLPNPLKDGRLPVNLAAARDVRRALGQAIWLRGAVAGPFSLATSLVGAEAVFLACLDQPEWVHSLLAYAGRIIKAFARGYLDAGVELVVFDSQASPAMISPAMYEEFVLPATQELVRWAATQGVRDLPLVIGGDTTRIAGLLARTGANNLLCDFSADFDTWAAVCGQTGRAFRRNVSPRLIAEATPDEIHAVALREVCRGRDRPGFILGTGVIPYGTPTENILAIKRACRDGAGPGLSSPPP